MKKKLQLLLYISVFCAAIGPQVQGQTYYNYAMAQDIVSILSPSQSLIRTVNNHSAVAYYGGPGVTTSVLAYIDLSSLTPNQVPLLELDNGYDQVKDIRIENGVVFFCGANSRTGRGFIGHVTLTDLQASVPGSIHCYDIDVYGPNILVGSSTIMWRLAAYDDGSGMIRVVCLGNAWYNNNDNIYYHYFDVCPYNPYCQSTFFVECTYSGVLSNLKMKVVGTLSRFERADDVVVSDNWLSIVSYYPDQSEIIIHRCKKNDVVGTFDNFYSYYVPYLDGVNHCCHMRGDTIADATLFCFNGGAPYSSRLRIFDLGTMTMTHAQQFDLLDKAEPLEMAYMSDYATLVSLQYQMYPSGAHHYTFVSWKPYSTTPYNAKLTYENNDYILMWMDRLTTKHIVATGGNYWLMKDIISDYSAPNCYTIDQQPVIQLQPSIAIAGSNSYGYHTMTPTSCVIGQYLPPLNLNIICHD